MWLVQHDITVSNKRTHNQSINQSKVVYCSPNLQNEFAVHVGLQSSDKRGNPKERTVPLAGSPSFTISLRCITNKVVFVNTYLKNSIKTNEKAIDNKSHLAITQLQSVQFMIL